MPYGRKPKYRESDYSMNMKSCIIAHLNANEDNKKEAKETCSQKYKKLHTKSRRRSHRYPSKMR